MVETQTSTVPVAILPNPLRLDLGCGKAKKEGFYGVDVRPFDGVDCVFDLGGKDAWPFPSESVDEVHCSHMVEHLTWPQRVRFFNELCRVMKKGAKALVVIPHWCSSRYYGDPTHQSPMSEWAFLYLNAAWREKEAPHTDYTCDFDHTLGYGINPALGLRSQEFQQFAIANYKESCMDTVCTLIRR